MMIVLDSGESGGVYIFYTGKFNYRNQICTIVGLQVEGNGKPVTGGPMLSNWH
jgi:hypothetical protein